MSTNNEYFTVLREQKEAQGESDYLRQLEDEAKMLPPKKKHLPASMEHISGFGKFIDVDDRDWEYTQGLV